MWTQIKAQLHWTEAKAFSLSLSSLNILWPFCLSFCRLSLSPLLSLGMNEPLPVSMLSLTIQFPLTRTASHCMMQPFRGTSRTSPGTSRSDGMSWYSTKNERSPSCSTRQQKCSIYTRSSSTLYFCECFLLRDVFTRVCHSVHRGCLPDTPSPGTRGRNRPDQADTPPHSKDGHCSARYASYWNVFLCIFFPFFLRSKDREEFAAIKVCALLKELCTSRTKSNTAHSKVLTLKRRRLPNAVTVKQWFSTVSRVNSDIYHAEQHVHQVLTSVPTGDGHYSTGSDCALQGSLHL